MPADRIDTPIAEPFLDTVRARTGHFAFESGHHSDLWMDLETLCRTPAALAPHVAELAQRLRVHQPEVVCGALNEGAFVALMVASALNREFAYAERFERHDAGGMFPIEYRLPAPLHAVVSGRRVAVVNDVISAGSAVRGTIAHLDTLGARVVAIGSLLTLGDSIGAFAGDRRIALESLAARTLNLWTPADCPLCAAGVALERRS